MKVPATGNEIENFFRGVGGWRGGGVGQVEVQA